MYNLQPSILKHEDQPIYGCLWIMVIWGGELRELDWCDVSEHNTLGKMYIVSRHAITKLVKSERLMKIKRHRPGHPSTDSLCGVLWHLMWWKCGSRMRHHTSAAHSTRPTQSHLFSKLTSSRKLARWIPASLMRLHLTYREVSDLQAVRSPYGNSDANNSSQLQEGT